MMLLVLVVVCLKFVVVCGGHLGRIYVNYEDKKCAPPLGDICIEIRKCPFFSDLLDKTPIPRSRAVANIMREHMCGFEDNRPKVCCHKNTSTTDAPSTTTTQATTTARIQRQIQTLPSIFMNRLTEELPSHRNYHLLPLNQCGPIPTNSRITSGKKTGLEEFPWMALIAYNTDEGIDFRCGGSIISNRYVITAAHCILNSTILGVRLGEYDLNTLQDCADGYCAPPVQDFNIAKVVVHHQYNPKTFDNDVALIRLDYAANFSYSNVQPICLPVSEMTDDLTGKFAIVSGWGVTEKGQKSSVLLKASVPVLPITTCRKIYQRFASITDDQICAGGYKGKDSCGGDSGGPMMYVGLVDGSPRYIQYGIVSYGPKLCGTEGQPGIYTRVASYIEWILDNMEP